MRRSLLLCSAVSFCLVSYGILHADNSQCEPVATCEPDGLTGSCNCDCELPECRGQRLVGLLPSDHCFDRFVSPISNPFFFEDPRSLTEVRGIFLDNALPDDLGGGNVTVWSAQLRARLSNRWSIIAPRLGTMEINQGSDDPSGFMSAPIGFKYNLFRDVQEQRLASIGATYFIPGATEVFQGFGDGDFHFFLSGGVEFLDNTHWVSGTGFRIPSDSNWGTQLWYWSNQWDYELPGKIYPLIGVNWFHWLRDSKLNATGGISGLDIVNLPTTGVAGKDVATCVVGIAWKPSQSLEVAGGYEFPLTENDDILKDRAYASLIFRY